MPCCVCYCVVKLSISIYKVNKLNNLHFAYWVVTSGNSETSTTVVVHENMDGTHPS